VASTEQTTRLERPGGYVTVEEIGEGRRRVETFTDDPDAFVGCRSWETAYPLDLIETILDVKGLRSVGDEIRREEDPKYLQHVLWWTLRAHVDPEEIGSARILDFGCGSGASTMILSRMFPEATFLASTSTARPTGSPRGGAASTASTGLSSGSPTSPPACRRRSASSTTSSLAPCSSTCCRRSERASSPPSGDG